MPWAMHEHVLDCVRVCVCVCVCVYSHMSQVCTTKKWRERWPTYVVCRYAHKASYMCGTPGAQDRSRIDALVCLAPPALSLRPTYVVCRYATCEPVYVN